MATNATGAAAERDGFIAKWRRRFPEWLIAEVFLPAPQRARWLAWLALRQELLDAAWGGADPRPGEAKLGWWMEELQGWAQDRRRHPLGLGLQSLSAPWAQLATSLPALGAVRGSVELASARVALASVAEAIAAVDAALGAEASQHDADAIAFGLLAQRALLDDGDGLARELLLVPAQQGVRAERIGNALLLARLQRRIAGQDAAQPLSRWRALVIAWRAARPKQHVPPA